MEASTIYIRNSICINGATPFSSYLTRLFLPSLPHLSLTWIIKKYLELVLFARVLAARLLLGYAPSCIPSVGPRTKPIQLRPSRISVIDNQRRNWTRNVRELKLIWRNTCYTISDGKQTEQEDHRLLWRVYSFLGYATFEIIIMT
jgi:hypothetical protein